MIGCEMAEDNFSGRTRYRDVQFNSIPRLIDGTLGRTRDEDSHDASRAMPGGIMPDAMWTLRLLLATSLLPTRRSGDSTFFERMKKERVELLWDWKPLYAPPPPLALHVQKSR